jgi:hypothetical protein
VRSRPYPHAADQGGSSDDRQDERPQLREQRQQSRRVVGLTGRDGDHQRQPVPVDPMVGLGRRPAAGTTEAVIRRLESRILVDRPSPLCGGQCSSRADARERWWSRQRPTSPALRRHRLARSTRPTPRPRCRRHAPMPGPDRLPWPGHLRQITPGQPTPVPVDDRLDHRPRIRETDDPADPSATATSPRSTTTGHQTTTEISTHSRGSQRSAPMSVGHALALVAGRRRVVDWAVAFASAARCEVAEAT